MTHYVAVTLRYNGLGFFSEDLPLSSIWRYIPIPVLVLLVLLPGIAFRVQRRGRLKESELHVRWPWWRRPPS